MFDDIAGSRAFTSSGIAQIPYPVKIMWLDENGIVDEDERKDYLYVIKAMDNAYVEHYYEKQKVK